MSIGSPAFWSKIDRGLTKVDFQSYRNNVFWYSTQRISSIRAHTAEITSKMCRLSWHSEFKSNFSHFGHFLSPSWSDWANSFCNEPDVGSKNFAHTDEGPCSRVCTIDRPDKGGYLKKSQDSETSYMTFKGMGRCLKMTLQTRALENIQSCWWRNEQKVFNYQS